MTCEIKNTSTRKDKSKKYSNKLNKHYLIDKIKYDTCNILFYFT